MIERPIQHQQFVRATLIGDQKIKSATCAAGWALFKVKLVF